MYKNKLKTTRKWVVIMSKEGGREKTKVKVGGRGREKGYVWERLGRRPGRFGVERDKRRTRYERLMTFFFS